MKDLPVFRTIHKEEAEHHAEIVCSKKRLKKGTKKYNEEYNKAFIAYIEDAKESLYPSGELVPQKNPQNNEKLTTLELLRRSSPVVGHLTDAEYRKLCNSKEWKYLNRLVEYYTKWHMEWNKHIKRNGKVSDLEVQKMADIQKKFERHLSKDSKIDDPITYAVYLLELDRDTFMNKFNKVRKQAVKKIIGR